MTRARPSVVVAMAATLSGLAACDGAPFAPGSIPSTPELVRIVGPHSLLIEGDSLRLSVELRDRLNQVIEVPVWAAPRWTPSEGGPVAVRADGMVLSFEPGDATVRVEVAGLSAERQLRVDPSVITMNVQSAYLVQSVQRLDGTVPIMAGRDALLRIFVVGNMAFNEFTPPVHVHLYHDGAPTETVVIPSAGSRVPHTVQQGSLFTSWNVVIPAEQVRPGLAFRVIADPDGTVPRLPASRTTFPDDGTLHAVDVRELPPHRVRFVPVRQSGSGITGNIDDGNAASYLSLFGRGFPIPATEFDVRSPFVTGAVVADFDGWFRLLQEMHMLRVAEGSGPYYYGVVRPAGGTMAGVAMIGHPVALGWDATAVVPQGWTISASLFAHEVGHNFGRRHAPCGDPSDIDLEYPYFEATIGVFGYDMVRELIVDDQLRDIMSYCIHWVSDYTYEAIWAFREAEALAAADAARFDPAHEEPVLLVWGRIAGDGTLHLEPAFELDARPTPAPEPGPYAIQGLDRDGNVLFDRSFAGHEVADAEPGIRLFAFAIPTGGLPAGAIDRLRLTGHGRSAERATTRRATGSRPDATVRAGQAIDRTRIDWDATAHPMALVRDAATGQILTVARDGQVELAHDDSALEVLLSHGTGSIVARLRRP